MPDLSADDYVAENYSADGLRRRILVRNGTKSVLSQPASKPELRADSVIPRAYLQTALLGLAWKALR